ncbi:hypothetical protein [Flavimaricola marinus]|uniref:Transferrin-binding protein B C-lobe/N-lobe beta barrel domain-containing protein n=1 Tax=Flavimaricola marinus TaxID=1819565 RepID=A0A238LBH5_9RHOB|nr:hypothetical protein [Flavimaricola marinus]SMY07087.1 hypothetical protein LOM8899_01219 [Flavimaricola marinus]
MLRKSTSLIGTGIAMTLLGGCLGTENPDFNKQAIEAVQFVNQLEDLPATDPEMMPQDNSGNVEYRGVAAFNYDVPVTSANPGADLFADMSLTADFENNDISGSITSFNSANGNVSGTVDVTDGAIVQNLMAANGNGDIVDDGTTIALDLDLDGQFRGETGTAITGAITGSYTPEGESQGDIFGTFGVDQN